MDHAMPPQKAQLEARLSAISNFWDSPPPNIHLRLDPLESGIHDNKC